MNAHTPFDANQDWTNPYCQNSSNDPMVDALLGNAYHVVRTVYCNLGNLKLIYDLLNQYGMVIGVQSEAELKALTTKAEFARIYGFDNTNKRQVTDYLYVEGDRTGILPDDQTATGSWVEVATSNSGGVRGKAASPYIPYVYNNGAALGGETTIPVPSGTVGVSFIIVEGSTKTVGYGFTYDATTLTVTLAQPLEVGDEVVLLLTGTPAVPDNPSVSDWIQINWLYNGGYAVGGEQVITIPYTFESVPAIYKNGERYHAGLANKSYTVDAANQRILLTEPLAANDRLIVTIGGESTTLIMSDRTIQEVARSANVHENEVILSTNTTQYLNGKKVIYDVVAQKIYNLPTLPTNVYINSVSNGKLTYSPGNVTVTLAPNQQQNTRELWRRSFAEAGYNLVDGSFEAGGTLVNANDVLLQESTGKAFSGPAGTVAAGTNPASGGFVDVSFVLSPSTPKVNVAAYGFSESASAYENSIALQKAAAAVNAIRGCIVEFPEGTFNVGYQEFAGAAGLGYSYRGREYFYLEYLTKPVLLKFNNTKIKFGEGQRVGSFDPVTGKAIPTIQTNFDYRAYRGILFGIVGCQYVGVTGQLEIDFMGETVILGGEFGDRGYQCPDYGFWFIDNRQLSFNANYIAKNGAMDAIYIAGLNDSDCFSEVSGLNIDRMGRTGVVVAGGSNIRISGKVTKSGLGSIVSAPGHNFSIEPEKRKVDNVEFNIVSMDAIESSFNIYNTNVGNVRNVRVVGGVLENNVGWACTSNTSNVKYIGTTIRGVIGEHTNEFFDSDRDPVSAQMVEVTHYDRTQSGDLTPFKNGTHFDRAKEIRLKLINYQLFSEGLTTSRNTLGRLLEPDINGFTATVIGNITDVATTGQRVLALTNPVALVDFNLINRASGDGLPDYRAYVEIEGIANARIRNAKISSVGSQTILWLSAYFSAGGRDGFLPEGDPLNSQPALRFLPLVIDGYMHNTQSVAGYGRVFLVTTKPVTGSWDWVVGDTLICSKPTSGEVWGWKCTVAGKAGAGAVFEAMGTMP